MKKRQDEALNQEALFQWALSMESRYNELALMFHIPNGGKRNVREAARLKREGVKAGIPDICLPVARKGRHGLYIELKSGRNRPTENQKKWMTKLEEQGYAVAVCYGWESASQIIVDYLS